MRHLSPEELLDIAEGASLQASPSHLTSCEACRKQLAELRAVMAMVADVEVPEPSPLFWEHLSARVHEAVDGEAPPRRSLGTLGALETLWSGLAGWASFPRFAALSAAAVAIVVAVALRPTPDVGPGGPVGNDALVAGDTSVELVDDPTFNLVSDLTGEFDFETALAAGLAPDGSAEHALIHMSSGELMELEALLKAEMPGSQVS